MLFTHELLFSMVELAKINRRQTYQVRVGECYVGSNHPVVVQSMTNTDTSDITSTVSQIAELVQAGSEIVRITVNNQESAKAVPYIKEMLVKQGIAVPIAGCFHYNGHTLLSQNEACAAALDKYRINPGNVGSHLKWDNNFKQMIECALKYDKPVRIGVNWGSLDQLIAASLMDQNAILANPKSADEVMREALVRSALDSATKAEEIGLAADKIIVSAKVSRVQDLIAVYRDLAKRCKYPLHLGLTESGPDSRGIVASSAALAILLQDGIGDTIRASLTPAIGGRRTQEVEVCQEILQSMGLRNFTPQVAACPGCGRTTSNYFQALAYDINDFIKESMIIWRDMFPGVEAMNVAVMGCIVNGPGESKHADIGISLPGTGENPIAPVFIDGYKAHTLRGDNITDQFKQILTSYVEKKYGQNQ